MLNRQLEKKLKAPFLSFSASHPPFWDLPRPLLLSRAAILPLTPNPNYPQPPGPQTDLYFHQTYPPSLVMCETEGGWRGKAPRKYSNSLSLLGLSPLVKRLPSFSKGWSELYVPGGCKPLFLCSGDQNLSLDLLRCV